MPFAGLDLDSFAKGIGITTTVFGAGLAYLKYCRELRRPTPIFETTSRPLDKWPGWQLVAVVGRNRGPAAITVIGTHPGRLKRYIVLPYQSVAIITATGIVDLPPTPPTAAAIIKPIDWKIRPDSMKTQRITFLVGPGGSSRQSSFLLVWHWSDAPNRKKTTKIRF